MASKLSTAICKRDFRISFSLNRFPAALTFLWLTFSSMPLVLRATFCPLSKGNINQSSIQIFRRAQYTKTPAVTGRSHFGAFRLRSLQPPFTLIIGGHSTSNLSESKELVNNDGTDNSRSRI